MRNYIKYNIQQVKKPHRAKSLIQNSIKYNSPGKCKCHGKKPHQQINDRVKKLENQLSEIKNQSHLVEDLIQIKTDIRMIKSYLFGQSNGSKLRKTSDYEDGDQQQTIYTIGKQARMKSNNSQADEGTTVQHHYGNYLGNLKNSRSSNSPQKRIYRIQDILQQKIKKSGSSTSNKPGIQLKSLQNILKDYKLQGPQSGTIFFGYSKRTSQPIAVKYFSQRIDQVIQVYDRLWKNIAKIQWSCLNRILDYKVDQMNILVMQKNKSNIIGLPYKNILIDLVKIIQFIHDCGYLYRNVQPQHFMLNQQGQLVVIDFKRARRYIDIKGHPIQVCDTIYTGSPFASNNQVRGQPQSRKDDLQSIGYLSLLLFQMQIPWGGMGKEQVIKIRSSLTLQQLFKDKPEWIQYMAYIMKLSKNQRPDYSFLCQLISKY